MVGPANDAERSFERGGTYVSVQFNKGHELMANYAIEGLRGLLLVNGGAVVAILSFAGNAGSDRIKPAMVANSLAQFAWGLGVALLAVLFTYLAQAAATHGRRKRTMVLETISTSLAVVSLLLFAWGAYTAREGFNTAVPAKPTPVADTCERAVEFIRAQADAGQSSAHIPGTGGEAVKIRGGWVVLPACN